MVGKIGAHRVTPLMDAFHQPAGYFPHLDLVKKSSMWIESDQPPERFPWKPRDHSRHTKVAAGNSPNRLGARDPRAAAAGIEPES